MAVCEANRAAGEHVPLDGLVADAAPGAPHAPPQRTPDATNPDATNPDATNPGAALPEAIPGAVTAPAGERVEAVAARLADVRERVAAAAARAGRSPHAVTLVAVSKGFPVAYILAARRAGQVEFGENTAQQLRAKAPDAGPGVQWHFVGRLQRSNVKHVVALAGLIHSIDRLDLAEAVALRARSTKPLQRVLVQVNVGRDAAKGGCAPEETGELVAAVRQLPGIACQGLMTVPPLGLDPRGIFAELRGLRDALRERFPEVQHLSMGMSEDFETAVEEGATIVRVGQALFGPRPHAPRRAEPRADGPRADGSRSDGRGGAHEVTGS